MSPARTTDRSVATATYGTVECVEQLTPHMVRVVLGGDGLVNFEAGDWTDSYVNAQFVPAGAAYAVPFDDDEVRGLPREQRPVARRYTVREWDARQRLLSLDFVVHGDDGVAGRWAQAARPGDRLQLRGPSGSYTPDPAADWHLLVGDESALPAIAAALQQVPAGVPVRVVLEVHGPADEITLPCPGELRVTWVHRDAHPGPDDLLLVRAVRRLDRPAGRVHAFVHGEAGATRALRTLLLGEWQIPREDLSCSPYWRRRYTDEGWREIKSAWLAQVEQDV